jgi:hypothetical protein
MSTPPWGYPHDDPNTPSGMTEPPSPLHPNPRAHACKTRQGSPGPTRASLICRPRSPGVRRTRRVPRQCHQLTEGQASWPVLFPTSEDVRLEANFRRVPLTQIHTPSATRQALQGLATLESPEVCIVSQCAGAGGRSACAGRYSREPLAYVPSSHASPAHPPHFATWGAFRRKEMYQARTRLGCWELICLSRSGVHRESMVIIPSSRSISVIGRVARGCGWRWGLSDCLAVGQCMQVGRDMRANYCQ